MGIPLCSICWFSLASFNICSLCLICVNLINMCLGVFCLEFILFETLWASWTWVTIYIPIYIIGKFSTIISSSILSWSFFLSSFGTLMIRMLGCLTLSQRPLRFSSFLFFFSFFLSASFFYHSIFYLTYPIFCLCYSPLGSLQSVFDLIYCIIHYLLTLFYFS